MIQYEGNNAYTVKIGNIDGVFNKDDLSELFDDIMAHDDFTDFARDKHLSYDEGYGRGYREAEIEAECQEDYDYDRGYEEGLNESYNRAEKKVKRVLLEEVSKLLKV